jgi:hypothetical protein
VIYADGREEDVIATPRAQTMAEERYSGVTEATKLRATYFIAWASLWKAGRESADFETWLDKVADIEEPEDKPSGRPTTGDGPPPEESSPSAS